jgi:hypothetical protein
MNGFDFKGLMVSNLPLTLLNILEKIILFGTSWGSILGVKKALKNTMPAPASWMISDTSLHS